LIKFLTNLILALFARAALYVLGLPLVITGIVILIIHELAEIRLPKINLLPSLGEIFIEILWVIFRIVVAISDFFYSISVILDVVANVIGAPLWNIILKKKGGYAFGNRHDTISYAMMQNKLLNNLTAFGKGIAWILDHIDPGHLERTLVKAAFMVFFALYLLT